MKKNLTAFLSLILALLIFSASALAETVDAVTGEWYGLLLSRPVTLTLYEDGGYVLSVESGSQVGTWEREGDALFMDRGTKQEQTLFYDGLSITMDDVVLTREPVQPFTASPARTDALLEEFQGDWYCTMISLFGETLAVEEYDETVLKISGTHMTRVDLGEALEYDGEFVNGALHFVDAPADSEPVTMIVQLHADGMLSLDIPFGDESGIVSYFVRERDTRSDEDE